jgi:GTP-binding protein
MESEFTPAQIEEARKIFAGPCDFIWGSAKLEQLPEADRAEIAFAGRSNVGKSSLVNALTGRKTLAKISQTPGRTQQLNYFSLGEHLYLVDMPGYGYAKVSKKQREDWDNLIFGYLRGRPTLRTVMVLVDSRHGLKEVDQHLMDLLDKAAVNYRIILTKCDKISAPERQAVQDQIMDALRKHPAAYPAVFYSSSENGEGVPDLRAAIIALK